jgi:hypothetical protein
MWVRLPPPAPSLPSQIAPTPQESIDIRTQSARLRVNTPNLSEWSPQEAECRNRECCWRDHSIATDSATEPAQVAHSCAPKLVEDQTDIFALASSASELLARYGVLILLANELA